MADGAYPVELEIDVDEEACCGCNTPHPRFCIQGQPACERCLDAWLNESRVEL